MTPSQHIEFPRSLVSRILRYAQENPAREICGLVGATAGRPVSVYRIDNVAADPERRFRLNPEQQIAAMRTMREHGEELYAIFHSHPSTAAEPSATDLAESAYPDVLYLIVSLGTPGVLELRGFRRNTSQVFVEVPLRLFGCH